MLRKTLVVLLFAVTQCFAGTQGFTGFVGIATVGGNRTSLSTVLATVREVQTHQTVAHLTFTASVDVPAPFSVRVTIPDTVMQRLGGTKPRFVVNGQTLPYCWCADTVCGRCSSQYAGVNDVYLRLPGITASTPLTVDVQTAGSAVDGSQVFLFYADFRDQSQMSHLQCTTSVCPSVSWSQNGYAVITPPASSTQAWAHVWYAQTITEPDAWKNTIGMWFEGKYCVSGSWGNGGLQFYPLSVADATYTGNCGRVNPGHVAGVQYGTPGTSCTGGWSYTGPNAPQCGIVSVLLPAGQNLTHPVLYLYDGNTGSLIQQITFSGGIRWPSDSLYSARFKAYIPVGAGAGSLHWYWLRARAHYESAVSYTW